MKEKGYKNLKMNYNQIKAKIGETDVLFISEGGGRIEHNYEGNKCSIYGYSKSYGHVDHKIARQLISKELGYGL